MTATTQHMQALATANERRLGVAEFKRETRRLGTRAGAQRVAGLLESDDIGDVLGAAKVKDLLLAIPHLGQRKVGNLFHLVGVRNWDKRLRELTPRQRTAIAIQLRLWVERWQERSR